MSSLATVLTTVNAPYSERLDASSLARCLQDPVLARTKPGHVAVFFAEVPLKSQIEFAAAMGIELPALVNAARAFSKYSGQDYPLAA